MMTMSEPEHDEQTCISAGELRGMGVAVPPDIPDCAWVPRSAIRIGPIEKSYVTEAGESRCTFGVDFVEPFRWISLDVMLEDRRSGR